MKSLKTILISVALLFHTISFAEASEIRLMSLIAGKNVQAGRNFEATLNLQSSKNIKLGTFYLTNSEGHILRGTAKQTSSNLRDAKWLILIPIPENVLPGIYRLVLTASSGAAKWKSEIITVQVTPSLAPVNQSPKNEIKNFKYLLDKTCGPGGKNCPRVSGNLLNPSMCKISDATYPSDSTMRVSSGFPPPPASLAGKKNVKLTWIPINFADRKNTPQFLKEAERTALEAEGFYEFNSFNRVNFEFVIPEPSRSINLPREVAYYEKLWGEQSIPEVTQFLLDNAGGGVDTTDAIMFIWPPGKYSITQKTVDESNVVYRIKSGELPRERVYGIHGEIDSEPALRGLTHGAGHALYSFEDLYVFSFYSGTNKNEQPASFWDVMGGGGDFYGWAKWIAGWLIDQEVNCVESKTVSQVVYLTSFQDPSGKKLIVIPVSDSEVLLAEYRANTKNEILARYNLCPKNSKDPCSTYKYPGLLVYSLDTKIKHGNAPYENVQTVDDPLLTVGKSLTYKGHKFKVLASDGSGIYVEIAKV